MKKKFLIVALLVCTISAHADDVMTKTANGTYIVNTTTLAKDVEGYAGPIPIEVHIKNNKIIKVVPLKTQDGPKYVARVKKEMLPKYEGMTVKKGTVGDVDAVTGATFTSKAIQENVRRAVEYYKKHK